MKKNVLIVLPGHEAFHDIFEDGLDEECTFVYENQKNVSDELIHWADIVLGNIFPPERINAAPNIKYIALETAGADAFVKPGVLAPNTVLTNATGVYSKSVAELGLALTLSLMKNLPFYRDMQSDCCWYGTNRETILASSPEGKVVLIVGLGDIGLYYARLMKALGSYVIGVKRRASECPEYVDELYTTDKIDVLIGRADVIFSVLPGTKETYHFYNREMFAMMKNSAIFINCGRGASVDTDALCDALDDGRIASAACDVFEIEPLPKDHRAWKTRNLLITPHRAGYFTLPDTAEKLARLSAKNLRAWLKGEPLINVVDFETGYKK